MRYTDIFGIAAPELGWVPAPTYILRRARVLKYMLKCPAGSVLEIGCGAGALLYDLSLKGFHGTGIEQSEQAITVAGHILRNNPSFKVTGKLPELPGSTGGFFDYVISLEVLEHLENDREALGTWSRYLTSRGTMIISVPAHRSKWGRSDEWAGHYRRYDRRELVSKIEGAGLEILCFNSYGWPLSNLIEPLRSWIHGRNLGPNGANFSNPEADRLKKTLRSGIERTFETRLYPLYANFFGKAIFSFFIFLQNLFLLTDLGIGYIVIARKP